MLAACSPMKQSGRLEHDRAGSASVDTRATAMAIRAAVCCSGLSKELRLADGMLFVVRHGEPMYSATARSSAQDASGQRISCG